MLPDKWEQQWEQFRENSPDNITLKKGQTRRNNSGYVSKFLFAINSPESYIKF